MYKRQGWFGFNGGSQLKMSTIEDANAVAQVFVNTNMAAAGGLIAALIVARILFGKADLTMALNGALAGLVAITAEPLTPSALQATLIGGVGGVLVVFSILGLDKVKIDDPVGAISCLLYTSHTGISHSSNSSTLSHSSGNWPSDSSTAQSKGSWRKSTLSTSIQALVSCTSLSGLARRKCDRRASSQRMVRVEGAFRRSTLSLIHILAQQSGEGIAGSGIRPRKQHMARIRGQKGF